MMTYLPLVTGCWTTSFVQEVRRSCTCAETTQQCIAVQRRRMCRNAAACTGRSHMETTAQVPEDTGSVVTTATLQ